ncbi:helix-turn-helix transcriptional regulator [Uliginosibacterium sp. TH139]|uniref:helix-turn-helix domain-containing protein n=1 Tax=Uliginosibacterium sp. TH139 TaxID=2067453 RepID=UPI000C7B5503|nr:helix-turn-helix transcriptional regulator [Uliginosibacterium sp. TH139]PLK47844.1 hypothetical protein C0V76_15895 [Uliginosibacterium sp. TH139]
MEPTNLPEVIKQVEEEKHLSQADVARQLQMTPQNLSHVLKGRRKLPAEAAIELFDLTGIHPRKLLEMSKKLFAAGAHAGMILAVVSGAFFVTYPTETQAQTKTTPTQFLLCKDATQDQGDLGQGTAHT